MQTLKRTAVLCSMAMACVAAAATQDTATPGTYVLQGGSYTITVEMQGDSLVVVEPNKRSPYHLTAPGRYEFYNPNTETKYGIHVIDASTLEAYKPDRPDVPASRLVMRAAATASAAPADGSAYEELAQTYMERAGSDPANVQVWTTCAGVALKRAVSSREEADGYAHDMAQMLKQLMEGGSASPCTAVIPAALW